MIPIMRPSLPPIDDYFKRIETIWNSKMLSNFGANAKEFEKKAQHYLGNKNVRVASSCDTALLLGISALGLPRDTRCIVTPFTFNSTINAIIWNGLRPDFVDVDPETFNIDPERVAQAATKKTSAIVATHVFGNPCEISELKKIARSNDIPMIFDAAHAYGSIYRGKKIGTFGNIEAFSFSGTKLITAGECGLLSTNDKGIAGKFEMLRNYGFLGDYNSKYIGLNGKVSEMNAALGCLTLDSIEDAVKRRNRLASVYAEELEGVDGISRQSVDPRCRSTYKDFGIRISKNRDGVEKYLKSKGVQTKRYFLPTHTMPAYSKYASRKLPVTEKLYKEILCLPIFNEMDCDDAILISRLIKKSIRR